MIENIEEEDKVEKSINLKKFKGHHRRFPWAFVIRIFVAFATIFMIWLLMKWTSEIKENRAHKNKDTEFEIEYKP